MTDENRRQHNAQCLAELFPTFRNRVEGMIAMLEARGFHPRIQEAWRSRDEQLRRFRAGETRKKFGLHNITGKNGLKEALAVQLPEADETAPASPRYLLALAAVARWHGCQTGILLDLEEAAQGAVIAAIDRTEFDAAVPLGRAPAYVTPLGITVLEARHGKRPGPGLIVANSNTGDVLRRLHGD